MGRLLHSIPVSFRRLRILRALRSPFGLSFSRILVMTEGAMSAGHTNQRISTGRSRVLRESRRATDMAIHAHVTVNAVKKDYYELS